MTSKVDLKLAWCSFKASKFACENWHYSKCMPAGKSVKVGVWENNKFIGVVIFSLGANNNLAKHFGLEMTECVELTRVALSTHATPVTRIVSIAIKMLKKQSPKLKLIVSYADTGQGHDGIIYKAGNWIYQGKRHSESAIDPQTGEVKHTRSLHAKYGSIKGFKRVKDKPKHRFVYPLEASVVERLQHLATS